MKQKHKYLSFWLLIELLFLLGCGALWAFDFWIGDGDGFVSQVGIHTLLLFVYGQFFWLLIAGVSFGANGLSNFSLGLLSVFILLLLIEGILAFITPSNMGQETQMVGSIYPFSSKDTVFFKNLVPNSQYIRHTHEADGNKHILNQVNSLGIRGPEIPKKQAGEKRIILLGDSFMQSEEVLFEQSIGQQLQQLLGDSVRTIQHGFPSWSPLLQLNWLLRLGIDLEPDEVILFTYFNDFISGISADSAYLPFARFDDAGYPTGFHFNQIEKKSTTLSYVFQQHLEQRRLFQIIQQAKERMARHRCFLSNEQLEHLLNCSARDFRKAHHEYPCNDDVHFNYLWEMIGLSRNYEKWDSTTLKHTELAFKYIGLIHRYLSEKEIPLRIIYIPSVWQYDDENLVGKSRTGITNYTFPEGGINSALKTFCNKKSIPFMSLHPAFKAYKKVNTQKLYYSVDDHWNEQGHHQAAQAIYQKWF